ncbi:carboxy terminal-processing peptidase [Niveibacterium sp. 24ML]|uniref:carboxy terminal-processing peptidase n=1 Tax=Niveibacterium sp. 24ML TaxID=2985512 RepID=UPI00226FD016|nr:carboxy terminal-processing peptidase [Niveibacterium sp. 24ML]MCX9156738.1 carboxy terminal-processing peptidase [Niveibacterium sp. 24ML]
MKKFLIWALLTASTMIAGPVPAESGADLAPLEHQPAAARLVAGLLTRFHYSTPQINDALSAKVMDKYIEALDGERILFLQGDIDQFATLRNKLDDAILAEDVRIPFAIYNAYRERLVARFKYSRQALNQPFDFTVKESIEFDRKAAPWPKTQAEVQELWRKRVKNDWLRLRLAGQKDESIRKTLDKRYEGYLSRIEKVNSNDVFQIFMDVYATTIDPHTNYLGPRASEEFDIAMKLSLVGIGAVLQSRDDYTMIRELVPGGPAALSGKLKVGDRIVGVGQGDGEVTEVMGWRLDDVVTKIRGKLDTVVVLDVLPADAGPDGDRKLIRLIRKKINIEEQAAKRSIIKVKDGRLERKIGVITLPSFYEDFEAHRKGDKTFRSASRDVARLIAELKKEKVEGIVVDLRNNGGGSLRQAVDITGLFIDQGPVVQQRDTQGKVGVEVDSTAGLAWGGPLVVLINRFSASASEIFAAAIQDYGRGIVVGEPSFGKGTVQTVISLDQMLKPPKPTFGEVKLTVAEFYRINGSTTQLKGVTPDIVFPILSDLERMGESSYDNALPGGHIKAAAYLSVGNPASVLPTLLVRHEARLASLPGLKQLTEDAAELVAKRKQNSASLNEAERRAEREAIEAKLKRRAAVIRPAGDEEDEDSLYADDGLLDNERPAQATKNKKAKKPAKAIDPALNEAAQIVSDQLGLLRADPKLAAKLLPPEAKLAR